VGNANTSLTLCGAMTFLFGEAVLVPEAWENFDLRNIAKWRGVGKLWTRLLIRYLGGSGKKDEDDDDSHSSEDEPVPEGDIPGSTPTTTIAPEQPYDD